MTTTNTFGEEAMKYYYEFPVCAHEERVYNAGPSDGEQGAFWACYARDFDEYTVVWGHWEDDESQYSREHAFAVFPRGTSWETIHAAFCREYYARQNEERRASMRDLIV